MGSQFGILSRVMAIVAVIALAVVAVYVRAAILRWDEVSEIVRNLRALVG
jgi:uncharacterized membrane protein